jgi:hypothetical protein
MRYLWADRDPPGGSARRQPQKPLHLPPLLLPLDPLPLLPACPGGRINPNRSSRLPLRPAQLAALGYEPAGERPLIDRLRVIAEEPDEGRDELDYRLRRPRFPVVNCPGVDAKAERRLVLGDREHEPATADMLPKGLNLEVARLPNQ